MAHGGEVDEDTIAFFYESPRMRVAGEVFVENYANAFQPGTLTDHVLIGRTDCQRHAPRIRTRAKDDEQISLFLAFQPWDWNRA